MTMIGEKLSPILVEIEDTLWEFELTHAVRPEFTDEGFRAATKIFMAAMMDQMWVLMQAENVPLDARLKMVEKAGQDVSQLIKTYTDIDTHQMYKSAV